MKKNKIVILILSLNILACTNQAINNINPSPTGSPFQSSVPSSSYSSSPVPTGIQLTPSPEPTATNPPPLNIREQDGNFKIEGMDDYGPVRISLDENGDGAIMGMTLRTIKNFVINGEPINFSQGTYIGKKDISLDKNGNGLIVWGDGPFGCTGSCGWNLSPIRGRKMVNYLPSGDSFIISQSYDLSNVNLKLDLDENGNGLLLWNKDGQLANLQEVVYAKRVKNYNISEEFFSYPGQVANLRNIPPLKSINRKGKGLALNGENDPSKLPSIQANIYLQKIENNIIQNERVALTPSGFVSPEFIKVDDNGNGIALWRGAGLIARYITNYEPGVPLPTPIPSNNEPFSAIYDKAGIMISDSRFINVPTYYLKKGESSEFIFKTNISNAPLVTDLFWGTSDESKIKVSQDGKIETLNEGNAQIFLLNEKNQKELGRANIFVYSPLPSPQLTTPPSRDFERSTFTGKISDSNGVMIDGVKVNARVTNDLFYWIVEEQITVNGGSFIFRNAPIGTAIEITASKEGWITTKNTIVLKSNLQGDPLVNVFNFQLQELK